MFQIDPTEILGLLAATLTTSAFVPQVYKTWKTKDVKGLSLTMYTAFFIGIILWFIYGIYKDSISIILANIVSGVLTFTLIYLKLKYREKK